MTLDVGAFAKALEFASGVKPRVIGKPEPSFFLTAVKDMKLQPSEVSELTLSCVLFKQKGMNSYSLSFSLLQLLCMMRPTLMAHKRNNKVRK